MVRLRFMHEVLYLWLNGFWKGELRDKVISKYRDETEEARP